MWWVWRLTGKASSLWAICFCCCNYLLCRGESCNKLQIPVLSRSYCLCIPLLQELKSTLNEEPALLEHTVFRELSWWKRQSWFRKVGFLIWLKLKTLLGTDNWCWLSTLNQRSMGNCVIRGEGRHHPSENRTGGITGLLIYRKGGEAPRFIREWQPEVCGRILRLHASGITSNVLCVCR